MRIGIGFDVHRLVKGRKLILGGIEIPFSKGLLGHSDADVLLHAVMDAMLGAAGLGDIGINFPPSDKKYKGISSLKLLKDVAGKIRSAGYSIANIDSNIIAEMPKMSVHTGKMIEQISKVLKIHPSSISIKSKTAEGLGSIGKGKAIASQAVCLLSSSDSCR
ncbi:MAG: 2-C-methyl-D-erythritol 2,4-cyclodiphosphate synthase [Candidatus Saganbacteria bacterium]|nr:2-C-methyl-D-erythritol 2,4-cyclodiphosphate synthase [Candidatus Saganbacteria bacterium]